MIQECAIIQINGETYMVQVEEAIIEPVLIETTLFGRIRTTEAVGKRLVLRGVIVEPKP